MTWLLAATATGGCVGAIDAGGGDPSAPDPRGGGPSGPGNPGGTNPPGGGNPGPGGTQPPNQPPNQPPAAADPTAAGPMPLRRLTRREYNNTVRDLLGDRSNPANAFPPDKEGEDFLFRQAGLVTSLDASRLREAAETVAAGAVTNLAALLPCDPATGEPACARKFIETFGLRAYRRPLVPAEIDRLMVLYTGGRGAAGLDFPGAIRLVIEGMLQSPSFIYRWELGATPATREGRVVKLGPYEIASRLSYFLYGSMPDKGLFDAAAQNKLGTEAEIEAQARRMLGDPKARDALVAFVEEWLDLDQLGERPKDPKIYPEWKDDLKVAMAAETRAFVTNVVFDGDSLLSTLLTANFSFVNQQLAMIYGASGVTGTNIVRSMLNPAQRAGLLTQASFLSVNGAVDGSHPIVRGKHLYERLLCGKLPPPPPDVPPPKPPSAGGTTRERFAEHGTQACAVGCHALFDHLGFAYEHYDGIGRFRTMDNGRPVNASGEVTLDGVKKGFADARELARLLADSDQGKRCFTTQWTRFALSRADTDLDAASIESALSAFGRGGQIKELLVAVAKSRSFRYRTPAQGEMLP